MPDKDTPMSIDGDTPPATIRMMKDGKWVVIGEGTLDHRADGLYIEVDTNNKAVRDLFALKHIDEVSVGVYSLNVVENEEEKTDGTK